MSAGTSTQKPAWPVEPLVGPWFIEALNEGLARSVTRLTRPAPARQHGAPEPHGTLAGSDSAHGLPDPRGVSFTDRHAFDDPFTAKVMAAYTEALDTVLSRAEREDPRLRRALLRHGAHTLAEASGWVCRTRDGGECPRERPLEPERAAEMGTLLMECAALVALGDGSPRPGSRAADLIRDLGASVRRSPEPARTRRAVSRSTISTRVHNRNTKS
ncbi:hypothetical protein AB0D65_36905 [Streptomyces griseoloalbus]|uniref:TetR family transcriptional regulator n=1 Tax=Streptomyces griseoloalbus TaxID=67303 RepID=A0ABV3EHF3_9ACTN